MRIPQISCEGLSNPTGIDAPAPRLSWQMESDARGKDRLDTRSSSPAGRRYRPAGPGRPLEHRKGGIGHFREHPLRREPARIRKKVFLESARVGQEGTPSAWSGPGGWSMGLLSERDWKGKWIGLDGNRHGVSPYRNELDLGIRKGPEKAAPVGTRFFRQTATLPEKTCAHEGPVPYHGRRRM